MTALSALAAAAFSPRPEGPLPPELEPTIRTACAGAWRAVEVVLAGELLHNRLSRTQDPLVRDGVEAVLALAGMPPNRAAALADLRAARDAGELDGPIDVEAIVDAARQAGVVAAKHQAIEHLHHQLGSRRELASALGELELGTLLIDTARAVFRTLARDPSLAPWAIGPTSSHQRDRALAAFAELIASPASVDELEVLISMPFALDDNVQFTVYRPRSIDPGKWHPMLAFAHLAERRVGEDDLSDPVEEVQRQARQVLGDRANNYQSLTQDASAPVPLEGELTFVPEFPGLFVNPPRRSFAWLEPVHREEFRIRAPYALDGKTVRGRVTVFLGAIAIAEVAVSVRVDASRAEPARREPAVARTYRRIFASYSHRDIAIVNQFEGYARALGDEYLRDWVHLRTGEVWDDRLRQLIDQADAFQLFWSWNSMKSPFVRQEYEHALSLERPSFVRPTYWEEPMPTAPGLPPEALLRLHFQKLGGSVRANAEQLERATEAIATRPKYSIGDHTAKTRNDDTFRDAREESNATPVAGAPVAAGAVLFEEVGAVTDPVIRDVPPSSDDNTDVAAIEHATDTSQWVDDKLADPPLPRARASRQHLARRSKKRTAVPPMSAAPPPPSPPTPPEAPPTISPAAAASPTAAMMAMPPPSKSKSKSMMAAPSPMAAARPAPPAPSPAKPPPPPGTSAKPAVDGPPHLPSILARTSAPRMTSAALSGIPRPPRLPGVALHPPRRPTPPPAPQASPPPPPPPPSPPAAEPSPEETMPIVAPTPVFAKEEKRDIVEPAPAASDDVPREVDAEMPEAALLPAPPVLPAAPVLPAEEAKPAPSEPEPSAPERPSPGPSDPGFSWPDVPAVEEPPPISWSDELIARAESEPDEATRESRPSKNPDDAAGNTCGIDRREDRRRRDRARHGHGGDREAGRPPQPCRGAAALRSHGAAAGPCLARHAVPERSGQASKRAPAIERARARAVPGADAGRRRRDRLPRDDVIAVGCARSRRCSGSIRGAWRSFPWCRSEIPSRSSPTNAPRPSASRR